MSYCNQSPQIFPEMTLRENLALWTTDEIPDEEVKRVLEELNLSKFSSRLDEKIEHFSGGERSRIGIARTLLKKPKILFLDEPTASLDSGNSKEVCELLKNIHQQHPEITIVCVSHDETLITTGDRQINLTEMKNGIG